MLSHTLATSLLVALAAMSDARSLPQDGPPTTTTNVERRQAPMAKGGADGDPNCQLGGAYSSTGPGTSQAIDEHGDSDDMAFRAEASSCGIVACDMGTMVWFCNDQPKQEQIESVGKIFEVAKKIREECSKPEKGGSPDGYSGQQFFGQRAWNVIVSGADKCPPRGGTPDPDEQPDPRVLIAFNNGNSGNSGLGGMTG